MLEHLRAIFDKKQLLNLEFQPTNLKHHIGIGTRCLFLRVMTLPGVLNLDFFVCKI